MKKLPLIIGCLLVAVALTCSSPPPSDAVDLPAAVADLSVSDLATVDTPDLRGAQADLTPPADLLPVPARDWTTYPPVVQLDTSADVFALGDVHADYDTAATLLAGAKIISGIPASPTSVKWTAGTAVLVCTGDLIDKYTQNLALLDFMMALQRAAAAAGGRVIVTMGNHEAEFLADPTIFNTKAAAFVAELQAAGIAPEDVGAGKNPYGVFLRSLPFAARVRDWFFSHAGNTAGRSMVQLVQDLRDGVDMYGFSAAILASPDSLLEARLSSVTPWWELPGQDPATVLSNYATALGVSHLVVGHQPGKVSFSDGSSRSSDAMYQKFGLIFLIDVGMSRGVDSSGGPLLKIHKDPATSTTMATAIDPAGGSTLLWQG